MASSRGQPPAPAGQPPAHNAAGVRRPTPTASPQAQTPARLSSGPQDVTKDWRCRCGTINKAGTYLCSSRSCHCYFCLRCGQTGHQQRFCRLAPPPDSAPASRGAPLGPGSETLPAWRPGQQQDVTRDWRCKCGVVNKAGSFICAKRGCRVYFCLHCGGLGHQQRFCRQAGSAEAPPSGGSSGASPAASAAAAGAGREGSGRERRGPAASKRAVEPDESVSECVVCMDAPIQVTLFPCKHNITCASCTYALLQHNKPCPFCAVEIASTDMNRTPWSHVG
ncbi:hypothetical protein EMIHUDRAFT_434619 [Emiliania huxleyi CCMP1516]|uniref:RING-type domain-containing protein n=2 Tax=Emiliania huxleyi TaxID=2903 RepID=A0A0D3K0F2_EMIH1|nr:hypothetical protein EMIHUDRAFT_434619 [Emiliania huxleyi CCMP1516]EOD29237.1 hypothetical protein EMIHUDRAFT_434619 [Emiliania huxleyi CCMP1516]|eukprot:XP_005781666.1 hypothetical protein EMIHUDRAFT_434619 [Emiliania huxleyi CCMP1516]